MGHLCRQCWGDSSAPVEHTLHWGGDPHDLEPCSHRESLVEREPNERAHFPWPGIVPYPRDHLGGCGVLEIEVLNESQQFGRVRLFSSIVVASIGGVAEERGISEVWRGFPMPLPGVPGEVFYEPSFEDPVCGWFLACMTPVFGNFEGHSGSFLIEDSHRAEICHGDCDLLVGGSLDATVVRKFLEFDRLGFIGSGFDDKIDPV
ncbi:unnamed protein product [Sphagnum balticum]